MEQMSLFAEEKSRLFEKLCTIEFLKEGFKAVKKNGGSPGIDGVTVKEFESRLVEELEQLKKELEGWTYKPKKRSNERGIGISHYGRDSSGQPIKSTAQ